MTDTYVVAIDGLSASRPLAAIDPKIHQAAQRALNRTADRARTAAATSIRQQVAFPASYLNPSGGRLTVTKKATSGDLEAIVTGQTRPTSLARFAKGDTPNKAGVTVEVAPGFAKYLKRAFLIRLSVGGKPDLDTKGNLQLAIRLKPGETITNKRTMVRLKGNLYLLYGPSVSQVFDAVRGEIAPDTEDFLATEFSRLIGLDL